MVSEQTVLFSPIEWPLARGGHYKFLQVDWVSPIHGSYATALKGPLSEVEARDLVLSIS